VGRGVLKEKGRTGGNKKKKPKKNGQSAEKQFPHPPHSRLSSAYKKAGSLSKKKREIDGSGGGDPGKGRRVKIFERKPERKFSEFVVSQRDGANFIIKGRGGGVSKRKQRSQNKSDKKGKKGGPEDADLCGNYNLILVL